MAKNQKSLGQHWLKDRTILTNIAKYATMKGSTTVLEIGPGLGTLTSALFLYFDQVIAVEFDSSLAAKLPAQFPGKNLQVIHADILDFDLSILPTKYVVAGNIPYYITSPIIQKFLHADHPPAKITLLVQKEVAQRLAAKPGKHSILGLSAQIYAHVALGPVIPRHHFLPPPQVDSQIVILTPYEKPLATEQTIALIKLGFTAPRKKLATNLSTTLHLPRTQILTALKQINLPELARPADLTITDWIKLQNLICPTSKP